MTEVTAPGHIVSNTIGIIVLLLGPDVCLRAERTEWLKENAVEMTAETKQSYFDRIAVRWDSFAGPPDAPSKLSELVRRATAHQPCRILDVGCGTGILVPWLMRSCPGALLVELDFSPTMLAINRSKHDEFNIEYCCHKIESAPFPTASFDAIICFNVLPHLDLDEALSATRRLLRPNGRIAVGHLMSSQELNAFHASLNGPVAQDYSPPSKDLARRLADVGLTVLHCEERPGWYFVLSEQRNQDSRFP